MAIPSLKASLEYPLWACDFDPKNPKVLVVGGGGGPARTGVKSGAVTVLETSDENEMKQIAGFELQPTEDNISTLAVGSRKEKGFAVYAGANCSLDELQKGKNKHFRVFSVTTQSSGVRIAEAARESLFDIREGDMDTYQRLLRLSQPFDGAAQLGAAATGFAKESQIALFDVPTSGNAGWKPRGRLDVPKEPMDLDVIQTGNGRYQLAFCDKYDIFTVEVSKTEVSEPRLVYTMEEDGAGGRPIVKAIRFLTPNFLFAVANSADRKRAVLHGYRLPSGEQRTAQLAIAEKLPKSVTQATGMALRNLAPPVSPGEKQGDTQFVIAIASSDQSLSLYTLDYKSTGSVDLLANLKPFETIKSAHTAMITALSFSTFTPPAKSKSATNLSIKLASVSMARDAVVHSIPLKKHVDKSSPSRKGGPPRPARYVVAMKSKGDSPTALLIVTALIIVFMAIFAQVWVEAKGLSRPILGANNYLPASWTTAFTEAPAVGAKFMGDLLDGLKPDQRVVVSSDDDDQVGVAVDDGAASEAKPWFELEPRVQELWKQKLREKGYWAEDMGEAVLKGVFFGQISRTIAATVQEAL